MGFDYMFFGLFGAAQASFIIFAQLWARKHLKARLVKSVVLIAQLISESESDIRGLLGYNAVCKLSFDFMPNRNPHIVIEVDTFSYVKNLYDVIEPISIKYGQKAHDHGLVMFIIPGSSIGLEENHAESEVLSGSA